MKVFVAGATGALGTQLVPQLAAAGHDVIGMTRSPAKSDALGVEREGQARARLAAPLVDVARRLRQGPRRLNARRVEDEDQGDDDGLGRDSGSCQLTWETTGSGSLEARC